jgi:hypothetical protein
MPQNVSRKETAREYLHGNYRTFTNTLAMYMKKYGINRASNYNPYVIPFSLGRFMLGRTFIYNPKDSIHVMEAIIALSKVKRKKWL